MGEVLQAKLKALLELLENSCVLGALHVWGHQLLCQLRYSIRRFPGTGLASGEESEYFNSRLAACCASLRKMR